MADSPDRIKEGIIRVLHKSGRPMTALEIANELASSKKEVSPIKKEINRRIFDMKEVEKLDGKPPRWQLRSSSIPNTLSVVQHNLSSSAPSPQVVQEQRKYIPPGLPMLDGASPLLSNPPPAPYPPTVYNPNPDSSNAQSQSLEDEIIRVLSHSASPMTAVDIARAVGKNTAKDINSILYRLEREGKLQQEPSRTSKKLWKVASSQSSGAPNISAVAPPTGASVAPPPGIGSDELFRKIEYDGGNQILFSKVNAVRSDEPAVTPVSETRPDPPVHVSIQESVPVQFSVEESTGGPVQPSQPQQLSQVQASQPSPPSQQQGPSNTVSRPVQVEVDDRRERLPPMEPVTAPDPVNFKDRGKSLGTEKGTKGKSSGANLKMAEVENVAVDINNANNEPPEAAEGTPSRVSSGIQTLSSGSTEVFDSSSLSLESASTSSDLSSSTVAGSAAESMPEGQGAGTTGESTSGIAASSGVENPKKKKKKSKRTLAAHFPSKDDSKKE